MSTTPLHPPHESRAQARPMHATNSHNRSVAAAKDCASLSVDPADRLGSVVIPAAFGRRARISVQEKEAAHGICTKELQGRDRDAQGQGRAARPRRATREQDPHRRTQAGRGSRRPTQRAGQHHAPPPAHPAAPAQAARIAPDQGRQAGCGAGGRPERTGNHRRSARSPLDARARQGPGPSILARAHARRRTSAQGRPSDPGSPHVAHARFRPRPADRATSAPGALSLHVCQRYRQRNARGTRGAPGGCFLLQASGTLLARRRGVTEVHT